VEYNKKVYILGGGTISPVRNHLALCAPAFGSTAKNLGSLFRQRLGEQNVGHMDVEVVLTKMADSSSNIVTNEDVGNFVDEIIKDSQTQIVVMSAALCDYEGKVGSIESGSHSQRLKTSEGECIMQLSPADKIIKRIRKERKDILLVGFKTTTGATEDEQFIAGLNLLKANSCNLVLANDTVTRKNMIITPEEARYHVTKDRQEVLENLVDMSLLRSHLTFTRSTVVDAEPVSWNDERVPGNLRAVVDWCIEQNAYKPFRGSTVGHFAVQLSETEFLTSRRKVNFNNLAEVGLVRVETDGPDTVLAYGSKPSVGGQSQRIIFKEHPGHQCIVHFHCPLREDHRDDIQVMSQRAYECGSHECGQNTSNGLREHSDGIKAVMLDNHGPNIVFRKDVDPERVIEFIQANWDLSSKTGGPVAL
jgi:hypothetical protein